MVLPAIRKFQLTARKFAKRLGRPPQKLPSKERKLPSVQGMHLAASPDQKMIKEELA